MLDTLISNLGIRTMATMVSPGSYHLLVHAHRRWRRFSHKPIWRELLANTAWWMVLFLLVIPLAILVGTLVIRTHTTHYLLTGPPGSTADHLGPRIIQVLNTPTKLERFLHLNIVPDFVAKESCGSQDSIYYVNGGAAHLAFVEDGLPLHFERPPSCTLSMGRLVPKSTHEVRIRALMPLYKSPLHVVARRNLGWADLRDIRPHAKAYLGPAGGSTEVLAQVVLDQDGIVVDRQGADLDFRQGAAKLAAGEIEVGFFIVALNADVMQRLLESQDLQLLSIAHAPALKLLYPFLDALTIPAAIYKAMPKELTTIGTRTMLATSTDLSEYEVYQIATKLSEHMHDLIKGIPFNATKVTDTDPQRDLYYPLHEGALSFYSHDPPFFLNPQILAGIGTYLSVLFAGSTIVSQLLRNYRVQRIYHSVEGAARAAGLIGQGQAGKVTRYQRYLRPIRAKTMSLLRQRRLNYDDVERINEYIKSHL
jgi:TRAP transporter TAXI family solute receptor